MMSLRTPVTPFTERASTSARSRSAQDLAKPESWTRPFMVSTLIAVAATAPSSANFAFTCEVIVLSSTYWPTVCCSRATAQPPRRAATAIVARVFRMMNSSRSIGRIGAASGPG